MSNILWKPQSIGSTNMQKFINYVNKAYGGNIVSYDELYKWSINDTANFWDSVWNFTEIVYSERHVDVVDNINKMPGAKWFSGSRLNFSENLLLYRDDRVAIQFKGEHSPLQSYT